MKRVSTIVLVFLVASLVLSLGLLACNDDKNPTGTGGGGDQGLATSLVTEVVLPLIETLSLNNYVNLIPAPGAPLPTVAQPECDTLPICTSGTAQGCPGLSGYVVTFGGCNVNGTVLDGTVTIVPADATSGGATVDLTVDGNELTGTGTYGESGGCFFQAFETFAYNSSSVSATFVGSMNYCDPPIVVNDITVPNFAQFFFTLADLGRVVDVSVYGEVDSGPPQISVVVLDEARQNVLLICDGPLFGSISCYTGNE